ncbi:S-layer homology domain-containing protein [Bhargavaea ginsengi]|uniref:S-layer homology domain-containing protein n=1 Tax=Bhargavaea ginsengi TaxID=426757 RepID=A0A1H6UM94_9BACL|nr:S-layer homology domain-containing protein [Bhargavaea ginsengi]SEI93431.1 S-layer homology domain-containing protein [Bhargavaea ginsengi]
MKSMLKWGLAAVIAAGTLLPSAAFAEGYTDVKETNTHYDNILIAQELGILSGYPDGTFRPNQKLTRAHVIKALGKFELEMAEKTMDTYPVAGVKPFRDIPPTSRDQELYKLSLVVKAAGIFDGDPNNDAKPANLMSRQQMAKVLVNAFWLEDLEDVDADVRDLDKAAPYFRDQIKILSENGVTNVTEFRPTETTSRAQFASFLVRSFDAMLAAPIESVIDPEPVTTTVGVEPELPESVEVVLTNGIIAETYVDWDTSGLNLKEVGRYTITGEIWDADWVIELEVIVDDVRHTDPVEEK